MWLNLTKAGFHTHNGKVDFSPPLDFYINELTIHVCIIVNGPMICFSWCLTCLSAQVVFKWQWCDWTSTHPVGNCHTTGQIAWPSNWLLFVISRSQIGLKWDHMEVLNFYMWKKTYHFVAPHHPNLHPYVITCDSSVKTI